MLCNEAEPSNRGIRIQIGHEALLATQPCDNRQSGDSTVCCAMRQSHQIEVFVYK